mmetsp:Transcript_5159/g.7847  ORF Transcript_5159/g.7847 Transcript_5159/m.7847 type:complete len:238 (+) Transcript_5159:64-777(+)
MQHELHKEPMKSPSKPREIYENGCRIEDDDSDCQSSVGNSDNDDISQNKRGSPAEAAAAQELGNKSKGVDFEKTNIDDKKNREKRLAMNRLSARERRKRKHVLIENLQTSVVELTRENNAIRKMNQDLRSQLEHFAGVLTSDLEAQRSIPFGGATPLLSRLAQHNPVQHLTETQLLLSLQRQQQQQGRQNQATNLMTLGFGGATHLHAALLERAQESKTNGNVAANARVTLDKTKRP